MMTKKWERCPNPNCNGKRWLYKVTAQGGKVWLCCWYSGCGWRIELTEKAAEAFLPVR